MISEIIFHIAFEREKVICPLKGFGGCWGPGGMTQGGEDVGIEEIKEIGMRKWEVKWGGDVRSPRSTPAGVLMLRQ